jgi:hypothetical protein
MSDPKELLPSRDSAPQKPSSSAKVEANRRNAKRSTGPKTAAGKKHSSRNARKHNLLTKEVVITTGPGKEDEAEFARRHSDLRKFYQPVGSEEERLVGEIAHSHWLTKRAQRCEKAAVMLASETPHQNPELSKSEQESLDSMPPGEARYKLLQDSRGISHLLRAIEYVRNEVLDERETRSAPEWLLSTGVLKYIFGIAAKVAALKKEAEKLVALRTQVEQQEADKRAAELDLAAIPEKAVLDRTLRYETRNKRDLYKLEARLDELQDRRRRNEKTSLEGMAKLEFPQTK